MGPKLKTHKETIYHERVSVDMTKNFGKYNYQIEILKKCVLKMIKDISQVIKMQEKRYDKNTVGL